MSAHRDLKNAQADLNSAVRRWIDNNLDSYGDWAADADQSDYAIDVREAYREFAAECARLDEAGGSAKRYTSINAAHANLPAKGSLRREIIGVVVANQRLYGTGMTVAELKGRLRREHSSVSSAINFLMEHGWLRDSGHRRLTQYEEPAIVWAPTEAAVERYTAALLGVE